MVKLILGDAGSGKTKFMINKANELVNGLRGELVYIDLTNKHASQLHRDIRCVFTDEFSLNSYDSIYGLLCGMASANHDIEFIFIDGLDKILHNDIDSAVINFMENVEKFAKANSISTYISTNVDGVDLKNSLEKYKENF